MRAPQHSAFDCRTAIFRPAVLCAALAMLFALFTQSAAPAQQPDSGAEAFIKSIGYEAQTILRSDQIDGEAKLANIQKMLQDSVDLKATGRRVLGPAWRTATPEQRSEYSELFANYVLQIYPRALLKHQSDAFEVTGSTRPADRDSLVFSRVREESGEVKNWTWRVREENGSFKVIDLLTDGVSITSTLREEFGSYVFHHGLEGLLDKLRTMDAR